MKTIAFYLPQYHETDENNKWWGKGFTEWSGVKKAKPIYPGHYQPREPFNDNYYDLTNSETIRWQAKIARDYDVYGFCIYHYWFGDKRLLYKPAEVLLENRDIDINYCFSWANESWVRTWSAFEGNKWNEDEDRKKGCNGVSILAEQKYGTKNDWKEHFLYLLPFFQDERYIRIQGKPVFVIYMPEKIKCLHSMLKYWSYLAKQNGFDGIYFISTNNYKKRDLLIDANLEFEPKMSFKTIDNNKNVIKKFLYRMWIKQKDFPQFFNYKDWIRLKNNENDSSSDTYYGCFVGFDKTPREGRKATIIINSSPKSFQKYYKKIVSDSVKDNKEFVFINAWNEWGEGAYLEPDKKYGFRYLKAIKEINEKYRSIPVI